MKRLTRLSLALLVVTLLYWAYAYNAGVDFRNYNGTDRSPFVSGVFGRTELAWLVEPNNLVVWTATDGTGRLLPTVAERGPAAALFVTGVWTDGFFSSPIRGMPGAWVLEVIGRWPDGTITGRLTFVPLWYFVLLFGAVPGVILAQRLERQMGYALRAQRVARLRRRRAKLGRCACGYDLRHSQGKCPECGRRIRWVPVVWPGRAQR